MSRMQFRLLILGLLPYFISSLAAVAESDDISELSAKAEQGDRSSTEELPCEGLHS